MCVLLCTFQCVSQCVRMSVHIFVSAHLLHYVRVCVHEEETLLQTDQIYLYANWILFKLLFGCLVG